MPPACPPYSKSHCYYCCCYYYYKVCGQDGTIPAGLLLVGERLVYVAGDDRTLLPFDRTEGHEPLRRKEKFGARRRCREKKMAASHRCSGWGYGKGAFLPPQSMSLQSRLKEDKCVFRTTKASTVVTVNSP